MASTLALFLCTAAWTNAAESPPVFTTDVAPIVFTACAGCHHSGGDAPFSLTSYEDVRRRASLIATVTTKRYMPPWKPEPGFGEFADQRRLTTQQIDVLAKWAAAGAPEGPRDKAPALPSWSSGWLHGVPDLVLELPTYSLRADGADVFRNFVVTVPGNGTRYVRGLQFRPRSLAVHHANIRIDRTLASRKLDQADPDAGYEGLILHSADYPDGHFLGWTPGQAPPIGGSDLAWRLDGGSDLVIQLHLRPTGKVEDIHPRVGLYFTDTPPAQTPSIVRLGRQSLDIAPGENNYRVTDSFVLPVDAQVQAIQPHAHYRATRVDASAVLPDGSRRPLVRINDWDLNWQDQYRYVTPFWLPAGTRVEMEYTFDNSTANPRNPDAAAARVTWGWRSSDEMADVWLQVLTRSEAERNTLQQQIDVKMLAEDAVGCEVLLQREPNHIPLRNDTALIYMRLGRPALAWPHFETVTRLEPSSANAWYNEGVALEALGRKTDAAERYQRAVRLKPDYTAAHINLGSLMVGEGRVDEGRREYALAVTLDPANADAHANLAFVLLAQGESDNALRELERALQLDAGRLPRLSPFVWLLVAQRDPAARRVPQGRLLAERIVVATNRRDPAALDALAAAQASSGSFDEAIATATEAIRQVPGGGGSPGAEDIRGRLELYREHRIFTLP